MVGWPPGDQDSVYLPPETPARAASETEQRAALAAARVREGLPVSDEILTDILLKSRSDARAGIYTPAERDDIAADNDRVARARAVLRGAEEIDGGLQVCWMHGRRGIRLLLTAEHERYRRLLSDEIGADRVVVDHVTMTRRQLRALQARVHAETGELAAQGIFLIGYGQGIDGFTMEYLAWDPDAAQAILRSRYGESVVLRCRGATAHTFRLFPFASWHAERDELHVFYGLPRNGERPGGCQFIEDDKSVVVALSITDWRGAKTLIGGFTPCHATVRLARPLGDRVVIDDSANRVRPHWTHT